MHVNRNAKSGLRLFVVRHEGQRGDGVDENGTEASVERSVVVAVLGLHLQAHHDLARSAANELTLQDSFSLCYFCCDDKTINNTNILSFNHD